MVEVLRSTSSKVVTPCLDKVFSECGIPDVLRSDYVPPINSREFNEFSKYLGFIHRKVTPYWPRANGEVERIMRTIKNVIKTAVMENKSWKQEMHIFLRNYRATPHAFTKVPPAAVLFGRPIKIRLPQVITQPKDDTNLRRNDADAKLRMNSYAERKPNVKRNTIEGELVLMRNNENGKQLPTYDLSLYQVVGRKGSMITAARNFCTVTRNSSLFKLITTREGEKKPTKIVLQERKGPQEIYSELTRPKLPLSKETVTEMLRNKKHPTIPKEQEDHLIEMKLSELRKMNV